MNTVGKSIEPQIFTRLPGAGVWEVGKNNGTRMNTDKRGYGHLRERERTMGHGKTRIPAFSWVVAEEIAGQGV